MADPAPYQTPADFVKMGEDMAAGFVSQISASGIQKTLVSTLTEAFGSILAVAVTTASPLIGALGKGMAALEEAGAPLVGQLVAPTVDALFGTNVGEGTLSRKLGNNGAAEVGRALVDAMLSALQKDTPATLAPGPEGATRVASVAAGAAIGGTFNAVLAEICGDALPFDILHIDRLADIPDQIVHSLGLSRLVRQALAPLVKVIAADPMGWYVHEKYRPTLLPATTAVREIIRATEDDDALREDLRRAGYSDDRIDALIREGSKFRSVADAAFMVQIGQWSTDIALQHLRDAGYDSLGAQDELDLQRWRRIATFERALATAAIAAYARGTIDDATLDAYVHAATFDDLESAQIRETADAHRIFGRHQLTSTQAEECVLAGVLAVADYRDALTRENYAPDAIDALELLIRSKVDAQTAKAEKAAALAAAKAAQQADKAAAAQAKADAATKAKAIAQLGSLTALGAAYVQGLIPIERYNEVAAAHYDADTVGILDAELDAKKAAYVAQQQKAADAAKAAAQKGLGVGAIQAAVLNGVLTTQQMSDALTTLGLGADAVDVLVATTAAKLAAQQATRAAHDQAAQKAKTKGLNLAQAEALVRAGHWTMGQYNALLTSLGYDAGSIAGLDALLQDKIDKDHKAAGIRSAPAPASAAKGLTASQWLTAVVAGIKSVDDYSAFLVQAGYTPDAVSTLTAEAKDKLDAANIARAKRASAAAGPVGAGAPLADVTRAARLGLITIAAYTAALTARGYSADDVALETDLITAEIATAKTASSLASGTAGVTAAKALTLAQLATAVKDGTAPMALYTTRAAALGYPPDQVAILAATLADQVAAATAAQQRHDAIAARQADKDPSLATIEKAVVAGVQTMDQYVAYLHEQGYGDDDVQILDALLQKKVDAAAAKAAKA